MPFPGVYFAIRDIRSISPCVDYESTDVKVSKPKTRYGSGGASGASLNQDGEITPLSQALSNFAGGSPFSAFRSILHYGRGDASSPSMNQDGESNRTLFSKENSLAQFILTDITDINSDSCRKGRVNAFFGVCLIPMRMISRDNDLSTDFRKMILKDNKVSFDFRIFTKCFKACYLSRETFWSGAMQFTEQSIGHSVRYSGISNPDDVNTKLGSYLIGGSVGAFIDVMTKKLNPNIENPAQHRRFLFAGGVIRNFFTTQGQAGLYDEPANIALIATGKFFDANFTNWVDTDPSKNFRRFFNTFYNNPWGIARRASALGLYAKSVGLLSSKFGHHF